MGRKGKPLKNILGLKKAEVGRHRRFPVMVFNEKLYHIIWESERNQLLIITVNNFSTL